MEKNILYKEKNPTKDSNTTMFKKFLITNKQIDTILKATNLEFLTYRILSDENLIYDIVKKDENLTVRNWIVKDWERFESNQRDLTQEDFFNIFLFDLPKNEPLYLFTDEGGMQSCAFSFCVEEFYYFSDLYESFFKMEFFQLSFYCILSTNLRFCRFIDEEGKIHEIRFS